MQVQTKNTRALVHKGDKHNLAETGGKRWRLNALGSKSQVKAIRRSDRTKYMFRNNKSRPKTKTGDRPLLDRYCSVSFDLAGDMLFIPN